MESPLVCVSGVTGADLKKRIEGIMANRVVLRLSFARKTVLAAAGAAAIAVPITIGILKAPPIHARPTPPAKFEVASVKPCKPGGGGGFGGFGGGKSTTKAGGPQRSSSPGRLSTACTTVESLIRSAYVQCPTGTCLRDPSAPLVEGGPSWIFSDSYQIDARADGAPSEGMMSGPYMQGLLEDRFHLKIHGESREVPVYAVTVAKGGPKLTSWQEGSCVPRDLPFQPIPLAEQDRKPCRALIRTNGPNLAVEASGSTLDSVLKLLYLIMDRPVIDRTGISGRFDIRFEFARPEGQPVFRPAGEPPPPPTPPADTPDVAPGPTIFTVMEKQLGLKLEPSRGPRDFFVIDHIERPTAN